MALGAFAKFANTIIGKIGQSKAARSIVGKHMGIGGTAPRISKMAVVNMAAITILPFVIARGYPKEDRGRIIAIDLALNYTTLGFIGIGTLAAMNVGLLMVGGASAAGRGIVQGFRSGLEARSSLGIPFSHNTVNMQQAHVTMQYARSRMGTAYAALGSEASFFHAQYLSRR